MWSRQCIWLLSLLLIVYLLSLIKSNCLLVMFLCRVHFVLLGLFVYSLLILKVPFIQVNIVIIIKVNSSIRLKEGKIIIYRNKNKQGCWYI